MDVHIPTMFLVIIVVSFTLAILVGAVASRPQKDGLMLWALALALHAATYALFSLRNVADDFITIVVANTLLAVTLALFSEGLFQFHRRPAPRILIWIPAFLVPVLFYLLIDDLRLRLIFGGAIFTSQCMLALAISLKMRIRTAGRGQYFLIAALMVIALLFAIRAVAALSNGAEKLSFVSSNPNQSALFLLVVVSLLMIALGLVSMTKERIDQRYRQLALLDELTGLANRRAILDALEQQIAVARRSGQPLALLMMDIDHFKRVNDTFGHIQGDEVLRRVADIIRTRLRTQDIAGRIGGEEFLAILPGTTAQGGFELAEALRQNVAAARVVAADGRNIEVRISIGVHEIRDASGLQGTDMISAADQALYRAKENGRNRVEIG